MTAAHENPPTTRRITVTPPQMACLAVFDTIGGCLIQAIGLLGDSFGQSDPAEALLRVQKALIAEKEALVTKWNQKVQLVTDVPAILSKG